MFYEGLSCIAFAITCPIMANSDSGSPTTVEAAKDHAPEATIKEIRPGSDESGCPGISASDSISTLSGQAAVKAFCD